MEIMKVCDVDGDRDTDDWSTNWCFIQDLGNKLGCIDLNLVDWWNYMERRYREACINIIATQLHTCKFSAVVRQVLGNTIPTHMAHSDHCIRCSRKTSQALHSKTPDTFPRTGPHTRSRAGHREVGLRCKWASNSGPAYY